MLRSDLTDEGNLVLLRSGDQDAFTALFRKYSPSLYRYTRKNINRKEDCEEIIQETFESLWKRRESLEHITDLRGYLFKTVRYKIIRYFQHRNVIRKYEQHYILFEAAYDGLTEDDRTPELIQSRILDCIKMLPERCQVAFKLRILENLSNTEIAREMNISKDTVENYMVASFKHLRALQADIFKIG